MTSHEYELKRIHNSLVAQGPAKGFLLSPTRLESLVMKDELIALRAIILDYHPERKSKSFTEFKKFLLAYIGKRIQSIDFFMKEE
jgi:hypothetical protein